MTPTSFMEVYRRIQLATKARTQREMAKILGVHQPNIAEAKRRNVVPASWYTLLFEKYDLSQDWLRYGIGPMHLRSKQGDAPSAAPATVDSDPSSDPSAQGVLAPVYSARCPPSGICSIAELEFAGRIIIPSAFVSQDMLVLLNHADDMAPTILRGAYLGVNTADVRPEPDGIFVFKCAHADLLVRRVFLDYGNNRYLLRPDADRYPESFLAREEWDERTVGRVYWIIQQILRR